MPQEVTVRMQTMVTALAMYHGLLNSDMIGEILAMNALQDDGDLMETTGRVRAKTKLDAGTQTLPDEREV